MDRLPPQQQQVIQAHAALIVAVVQTVQNPSHRTELDHALKAAEGNGWTALSMAIRQILAGERNTQKFKGLDEEDGAIIDAILRGIQNPASLPDPHASGDAGSAAPGLASMIHAASQANIHASQALAMMSEQMVLAGGDMAQLASKMKTLVDGERDFDKLSIGLGGQASSLLESILEELSKLER